MPKIFQWSGRTIKGTIQKGELSATSKEEVIAYLRRQNIIPTIITPKPKSIFRLRGGKAKDKDMVIFTRQFSTMIDAGLPLVQALEILSAQTDNKALARVIGEVKTNVEGGSTFADALKKHPRMFESLYVSMAAAGEAGGVLDIILNRLAQYIEKSMKLKKKVKGAMIYPSVIIAVAILVVVIIMVFVVPTFAKMFSQLGGTLPLPTKIVISISNFLGGIGGLLIFALVIGIVISVIQFRRTERGKMVTDSILLGFPVIGMLLRKVAIAKFTRTLGTLVSSGVPILDSLDITAKTAGNKTVEKAVYDIRKAVAEGKTLAEPLGKSKVFPPMVAQMIGVGESTGALDTMLGKIADFYDDEVDNSVANLTSLLEPLLIVFIGVTVGFIVVAMYLPIFKLITLIK